MVDRRSRRLVDLSPDLMGTIDDKGQVVACNDAWRQTASRIDPATRLAPAEVLALVDTDPAPAFEHVVQRVDNQPQTIEWRVQLDEAERLRYVVGRDVTARNQRAAYVRELLDAVQGARTRERSNVAGELHDFVLQPLLVALMHLEDQHDEHASTADRLVRDSVASIRRVIDGIQPLDLEHVPLGAALERSAADVAADFSLTIDQVVDVPDLLDRERKLLAYRLVGEALRNAAKHAGADLIQLRVNAQEQGIRMRIVDNGRGFTHRVDTADAPVPELGTGFNVLIDEVLLHDGHIRVDSEPGAGTQVDAWLPARLP